MATKKIIWLPTLNNQGQITWKGSNTFITTTGFTPWQATSSSWWPTTDGGSYVDYNATTDQSGNVIGGSSGRITYDSWGKQITNTVKPVPTMWTNKSVAVMNANKNGTVSSLPQATPANLPWVTRYAGIDKNYWNNQAGIDLVNKQNELDTLSEAEKAQRLAGAYNPTPTVATAQNPVIKKTLDKPQEQTVTPAALQGADINTLNSTLDELNYKVNVEGKQLSKDEYLAYASAKRQLQDMMKPQALTGWLDSLITNKENEIKQVTDESKINNDQELADFTRSQEVYRQAEIDAINQADEEQKKTLWFILGWTGAELFVWPAELKTVTDWLTTSINAKPSIASNATASTGSNTTDAINALQLKKYFWPEPSAWTTYTASSISWSVWLVTSASWTYAQAKIWTIQRTWTYRISVTISAVAFWTQWYAKIYKAWVAYSSEQTNASGLSSATVTRDLAFTEWETVSLWIKSNWWWSWTVFFTDLSIQYDLTNQNAFTLA